MMSPEVPPECGTVLNQALVGSKISYLINVCLGASTKFWTQSKTSNLMIVNSQLVFKTWCPDPALDWVQNILPDQQYFILDPVCHWVQYFLPNPRPQISMYRTHGPTLIASKIWYPMKSSIQDLQLQAIKLMTWI